MPPTNVGQYIVYVTPLTNVHSNAKIIGGPTTLDYPIKPNTRRDLLWTCVDEAGNTFVIKHSQIVDSSNLSHNGFGGPKIALCPQCEEEEFFLEDDYICGYCRTNVIDP